MENQHIYGIDMETGDERKVEGGAFSYITKEEASAGSSITDIIKGHIKEFLNKDEQLSEERLAICAKCPLILDTAFGKVCNASLYVKGDKVSPSPLPGYSRGCGCRLNAKTRIKNSKCPDNKW